jgi:hypothetical protein
LKPIDLFIVGGQKCGTTSLLRYLSQHPNILGHSQMEMTYFSIDSEYKNGFKIAWRQYYKQINTSKSFILGKNAHMYRNFKAITRLKIHNPNCVVLFLIRNPVDRAYSSYLREKSSWGEEYSFDEVVEKYLVDISNWRFRVYFELGIYHMFLEKIFEIFGENVKVIKFSELKDSPKVLIKNIYCELGIEDTFYPDFSKKYNVTKQSKSQWLAQQTSRILSEDNKLKITAKKYLPSSTTNMIGNALRSVNKSKKNYGPVSTNSRSILNEFYQPCNDKLSLLLKEDFSQWK